MARRKNNMKKKSKQSSKPRSEVDKLAAIISKLVTRDAPKKMPSMNVTKRPQLSSPKTYLQALLNPFSPNVPGVKVPDFDGTPSYTLTSRDVFTVNTDASGAASGFLLFQTPVRRNFTGTVAGTTGVLTSGIWAAWSDYAGLLSTTNTNCCRVVAGGFRITSNLTIAGAEAAAGRIIIAPVPNALIFDTATWTESQLRKQKGAMIIPIAALSAAGHPIYGATRPLDPSAHCYLATDRTMTGTGNDDAQNLSFIFLVLGAPALYTAALEIEMICHWEAIPSLDNATLVTPGVASSAATIDEAANLTQTTNPLSWEAVGETVGGTFAAAQSAYTAYQRVMRPGRALSMSDLIAY